jgi:F-type H+-transporting ATPase subunit epsilon
MQLEVLSVKGVILDREVTSVVLPGLEGSFGVLPDHTPFLSILRKGRLYYNDPDEKSLEIEGGFVRIQNNRICVCLTD